MEFNEVVHQRRSIRKFLKKPISKELLEELIMYANEAPSWKNAQTARYHIAYSAEMVAAIKQDGLAAFNAENVKDAPVLIVTSFIKDRSGFNRDGTPSNELGNLWGSYDLGLQNENLLLKASDLGLSTLVMGIRNVDTIRKYMKIDEQEIIVAVIGVGYRDAHPDMPKRKDIHEIATFY